MSQIQFLDENGLLYLWQRIKTIFATESDLTSLENTVSGLVAAGGQPNVIETIQVNGSAQTVSNKTVNITVPTNNSQLANGAGTLKEGTGALRNGTTKLVEGTSSLNSGAGELLDGITKLSQGASDLSTGAKDLADGTGKLDDGAGELLDGLMTLNEEGIEKLTQLFGDNVEDVVDRIKAVKEAGERYTSFTGSVDPNNDNTVKFIYKTEAV